MKLSEAIRIGASWSKQIKIHWKTSKGTCALGACWEGTFGDRQLVKAPGLVLTKMYPYLNETVFNPANQNKKASKHVLIGVITELNDRYNWTREQIADWVEELEIKNGWEGTPNIKEKEVKNYESIN